MYKLIVFGVGELSRYIESLIDKNKATIIAYSDNNTSLQGEIYNGKLIYKPEYIKNLNYDFIIIASIYNNEIYNQLIEMKINKEYIFQSKCYFDYLLNFKYSDHNKNIEKINDYSNILFIVTGLSYTKNAVLEEFSSKKMINFAEAGQDIFYDYKTVTYILNNYEEKFREIKYCIIGLSYYSFQYDLSLSKYKDKCFIYKNTINDFHNYINYKDNKKRYDICEYIAKNVFNNKVLDNIINSKQINKKSIQAFSYNEGKNRAREDCNKNYPNTVKENIEIFNKYLLLLNEYEIIPIVIVQPVTKYYATYFSNRIEDEFHGIINKFMGIYKFKYLDFFRSELFTDYDFYDVSHLNDIGGKKITKILNIILDSC